MKMPKELKKRWVEALRSGEYGQTKGNLTNGKGGFCCLGVLQHVQSGGYCEAYEDGRFYGAPSSSWYERVGIDNKHDNQSDECKLIIMNDGEFDRNKMKVVRRSFKTIADWIEKNIQTTD